MSTWTLGLDLGQAADFTALAGLRRREPEPDCSGGAEAGKKEPEPPSEFDVPLLRRWPLHTPYTQIAADVRGLLDREEFDGARLVADATGCGRPVLEMLRSEGLYPVAVLIHGGDSVTRGDRGEYRVPKRDLAGCLQVLLQGRRLHVAKALPEAATLVRELQSFKVTIRVSGHDTYAADWREGAHDDLVLAVALAAWYAMRVGRGKVPFGASAGPPRSTGIGPAPSWLPRGGVWDLTR